MPPTEKEFRQGAESPPYPWAIPNRLRKAVPQVPNGVRERTAVRPEQTDKNYWCLPETRYQTRGARPLATPNEDPGKNLVYRGTDSPENRVVDWSPSWALMRAGASAARRSIVIASPTQRQTPRRYIRKSSAQLERSPASLFRIRQKIGFRAEAVRLKGHGDHQTARDS